MSGLINIFGINWTELKMENSKLESVVIVTDDIAPSFCYYDSKTKMTGLMPIDVLKDSINFCEEAGYAATVLYSARISEEHLKLLAGFAHIKVLDIDTLKFCLPDPENDIIIVELGKFQKLDTLQGKKYNIILRMDLEEAKQLPMLIYQYHHYFRRLNVLFKNIGSATESALNQFRIDIEPLKNVMYDLLVSGNAFELNMVTDRMVLDSVNSCDAGIKHLTIAPNGCFYVCPAFYYEDEDHAVGSLNTGIDIPNSHLLTIQYSALCRICDSYQCRRCVFLNKKMTHEVNTPSHQQCVLSHHERNLSGILLQKLQSKHFFSHIKNIPPLYYLDPLDYYQDIVK